MNWLSPILSGLGGLVVATGLVGFIYRHRVRSALMSRILVSLNKELSVSDNEVEKAGFIVSEGGKSAKITFPHQGRLQRVYVPYSRQLLTQSNQHYLVYLDGEEGEHHRCLDQKPGVPLLVTAEQLDGVNLITLQQPDE